ncbi:DnaB-like helicase C-terminal domain-containing protein [Nocardia rhizosphaerihabitans]|uniref:DnaB-like helicase C-terminal domain-containing protein n=1 Tax=Nocardia rhizosphaerihabitans TaxID=1691570 RepID=UPI00366A8E04
MFTLQQSARIRGSAGVALPTVWKSLEDIGVVFRKGQLNLICAGPGTGKSAFALNYAIQSQTPALYFSADSDSFTQLTRSIAIMTGTTTEEIARNVLAGKLEGYTTELNSVPIRLVYDASPSLDTVERVMMAYEEVYGDFPSLVTVDNVTNIRTDTEGDDPFGGLESLMDYLHTMARETESCVWGLHHVTGPYVDAAKPIPLSGVKGQISRVPEVILTLHRPDMLCVSTVKNRGGRADPSGETFAELHFIGDTMRIEDTRLAA